MLKEFKFIDLFCGIGGFHQAMESLGGKCVFASDIDKYCQDTYFKNYGIMPIGDITMMPEALIPEHDVLCGGFPCQAFSIAGKRLGFADPTKGTLFFDIMRIVNYHHPKYILLENVRNLASHDNGNTWRVIHTSLTEAGYNVSPTPVIFCPTYIGIPQHRKRVLIMAIRKDIGTLPEFYFNPKDAPKCTIDTVLQDDSEIKNIQKYRLKDEEIEVLKLWDEFLHALDGKVKKMPLFPVTDLYMKPSISCIDTKGMLEQKLMTVRRNVELYNQAHEFIDGWLVKAYRNPKFRGARRMLEWHAGAHSCDIWDTVIQFRQSGIRCRRPTHFPTLTAVMQIPIITKRLRRLTPRECARLQSFPDTFKYDKRESQAYKQFGNSVNVEVVKLFARFLLGDKEIQKKYTRPVEIQPKKAYQADPNAPKRKRGRPRKYPLPTQAAPRPVEYNPDGTPKRRRGRPRKYPLPDPAQMPAPQPVEFNPDGTPKRKRGRPRKYPLPDPAQIAAAQAAALAAAQATGQPVTFNPDGTPKRKRGRPRKYPLPQQ